MDLKVDNMDNASICGKASSEENVPEPECSNLVLHNRPMVHDSNSNSLSDSPLNLSPKSPNSGHQLRSSKPQTPLANFQNKAPESPLLSAPLPWNNWSRNPYLFPGVFPAVPMPPLCPLPTTVMGVSPLPLSQDLPDPLFKHKRQNNFSMKNEDEKLEYRNPKDIESSFCDGTAKQANWDFKNADKKTSNESSQHYQIKWSNHSSRLTSFISSLQGDVCTSDTVITAKDGTTFYAHRLVLAASSPFFSRTLKNIPREQQAVVVIPRASSRFISSILSFCYTGRVGFPPEDLKSVLELAEDLEISGLLAEKVAETQPRSQLSPSSVFRFTPPCGGMRPPSDDSAAISSNSTPPYSPFLFPTLSPGPSSAPSSFKREMESPVNYSQHSKRIKSDSEVDSYDSAEKTPRPSHVGLNVKSEGGSTLSRLPSTSLTYIPKSYMNHRDLEKPKNSSQFKNIISRQILSAGSRVLLWRFLLELLHDPRYSPFYIRWLDRSKGIFRIMESDKVAQLWGSARKNDNMTYEKMSRGMRTYYKRGILFHLDGTKLIYRFNVLEPEIQHVMSYHEMMTQRLEDRASSSSYQSERSSPLPQPLDTVTSPAVPVTSPFLSERERHDSTNVFFGGIQFPLK